MEERLQKLIAQAGIASRRDSEMLISAGRVTVNGERAKIGDKADPAVDDIRVDGARLRVDEKRVYIMVNKPMGIVTTVRAQDQEKRKTVREIVPVEGLLYPVGRLDADSEGLILLTNDGELAQKLTHPKFEHPKTYEVTLSGQVNDEVFDIWRRGVVLDDGPTKPAEVKVLSRGRDMTVIRVTMREGRKRQIRRIATTFGHPVRRLVRVELDTLKLGALRSGEWRYLTDNEIKAVQDSADSTPHYGKPGIPKDRRRAPERARPDADEGERSDRPQSDRPRTARPGTRTGSRTSTRSGTRPARSASRPGTRSGTGSSTKTRVRRPRKPTGSGEGRGRSSGGPTGRTTSRSTGRPGTRSTSRPSTSGTRSTTRKPGAKRPTARPGDSRPSGSRPSRPTSRPSSRPGGARPSRPTTRRTNTNRSNNRNSNRNGNDNNS